MDKFAILMMSLSLSGCAALAPPLPGEPAEAILARMGPPTARFAEGAGSVLEYARGPFGQTTYFAHIDADGRLSRYEQVLTSAQFAKLTIGKSSKDDVLRTVGHPAEHSYLALPQLEVWSYRYKEAQVWNSMMHLHFDRDGVLRMMQGGPDPLFEEHRRR
ncbi:MAG: hypothetical protein V4582_11855 [Pseudomonadota bacterium]